MADFAADLARLVDAGVEKWRERKWL